MKYGISVCQRGTSSGCSSGTVGSVRTVAIGDPFSRGEREMEASGRSVAEQSGRTRRHARAMFGVGRPRVNPFFGVHNAPDGRDDYPGPMLRIRIRRPGGYDRLELERDFDPGQPGTGEVLVHVRAAGINFADSAVRMGLYSSAKEYVGWPITPGFEFAGTIARVGAGVTTVAAGDPVFGVVRFGAWSSHVITRAELVRPLPAGLTPEQAAGLPTVFLTAYYPLFVLTNLRAGETVLVHSAAGGVGGALIQLTKIAGCRVIGVVGAAHKVSFARDLGADVVIDRSAT